ncbi:trichome birefringence-like [Striga asiatica]|uniref:Trichome birefringence-like n=1 Tax=Striga asiatica TaxID=4170 RepID=A0A5A7PSK3_STRAF|nr:trichome birefringence-like [Striga asiatica]
MAIRSPCGYKLIGVSSITIINVLVLANVITVSSVVLVSLRKQQQQKHNTNNGYHSRPIVRGNESCLFVGSWVPDQNTTPLYDFSSCPIIDPQFNCQMYGRPDTDYLKYRWQPSNCQIPRFDGAEFVKRMRGKSIMFVGDSIGRNQWESLICMISAGVGTQMSINRGETISTVKFLEYGLTVSFYKAPYLVDIDLMEGKRVLRLGDIRGNSHAWTGFGVDLLYFNTGHWWTHKGSLQGWDYVESDGRLYQDMDPLLAMEKALTTWAKWVDANIDVTKTTLFFQAISPTHSNPSEWNGGIVRTSKSCYGETAPISGYPEATYWGDQMRVLEKVISSMNKPPLLLDITLLSAMRKDAHPSIYSGDLTPAQRANPDHSADCSHWCLPGLPDTWNQLFYTSLFFSY